MSVNEQTITYYNNNSASFIASTVNAEMGPVLEWFLATLPAGAAVLDWGCGSGRDSLLMKNAGFQVTAVDASAEMAKATHELTGLDVLHQSFDDLACEETFDGIWACSSLLHMPKAELPGVFRKAYRALKPQSSMYISFKYGDFEGMRNGRYFTDLTEESLADILSIDNQFTIAKYWISGDVRPGRENEKWLNALLQPLN